MLTNGENSVKKEEFRPHDNPVIRWVLITAGVLLVAIGIVGVFLPLLPTTVFFLLAAWCFARSSEKFYRWLHNNKLFGKYISDYRAGRGMTIKSKVISISVLWAGILASGLFLTENLYVRILLVFIAVGVTWHLAAIKTTSAESK